MEWFGDWQSYKESVSLEIKQLAFIN
jgi:hypothetical protein